MGAGNPPHFVFPASLYKEIMKTIDQLKETKFVFESSDLESYFLLAEIIGLITEYPEIIQKTEFLLRLANKISKKHKDFLKENGFNFDSILEKARAKTMHDNIAPILEKYGIKDIVIGVPVKLGRNGIEQVTELDLTADEKAALTNSARAVQELVKIMKLS